MTGPERRKIGAPFPVTDYVDFRFSPDFTRLASTRNDPETGNVDIWITDLARQSTSRFTAGQPVDASPIWSPDGSRIVFRSNRVGRLELFEKSASGGEEEKVVFSIKAQIDSGIGGLNIVASDWSPDGKNIVVSTLTSGVKYGLATLPMTGEGQPRRLGRSDREFVNAHPRFSPDGKFIAYESNETGKFEVYVEPFATSDKRWQISASGGYEPNWRADGREIFFLSEDRKLMAATVGDGPSFGIPSALFQTQVPLYVDHLRTSYVPDRDGRRFLVNTLTNPNAVTPITILLNWTEALKK